MPQNLDRTPVTQARLAGLLYLVIFLIAPFAEFFVREGLVVATDAQTTARNIREAETLFRVGFVADLIVFVIEVGQAALLYVLLAPVSRVFALVMSFARLAQATILGLNLLSMFMAVQLLTAPAYAASIDGDTLEGLALVFLNTQSTGYELGLVFFALHLGTLGYLVYASGYLPRALGVLLMVSAVGYLANGLAVFLASSLAETMASVVIVTSVAGELPLTIWLLLKGVRLERWADRVAAVSARPSAVGSV